MQSALEPDPVHRDIVETSADITQLLRKWGEGDEVARDRLMPFLYEEMRRLARARMQQERPDHTLGATGLVHEAYLKLIDLSGVEWNDRAHLLSLCSRIMRHVLIDYARARKSERRGGGQQHVELDEERIIPDDEIDGVLKMEEALSAFEAVHPRPARAVAHCYFVGLTNEEAATAMDISRATLERDLRFARAWLAAWFEQNA